MKMLLLLRGGDDGRLNLIIKENFPAWAGRIEENIVL
jgi:hypothetical protein